MNRTPKSISFMIARFLLGFCCLVATVRAASNDPAPPFAVGQQWTYPTRKSEPASRLVILRIS